MKILILFFTGLFFLPAFAVVSENCQQANINSDLALSVRNNQIVISRFNGKSWTDTSVNIDQNGVAKDPIDSCRSYRVYKKNGQVLNLEINTCGHLTNVEYAHTGGSCLVSEISYAREEGHRIIYNLELCQQMKPVLDQLKSHQCFEMMSKLEGIFEHFNATSPRTSDDNANSSLEPGEENEALRFALNCKDYVGKPEAKVKTPAVPKAGTK